MKHSCHALANPCCVLACCPLLPAVKLRPTRCQCLTRPFKIVHNQAQRSAWQEAEHTRRGTATALFSLHLPPDKMCYKQCCSRAAVTHNGALPVTCMSPDGASEWTKLNFVFLKCSMHVILNSLLQAPFSAHMLMWAEPSLPSRANRKHTTAYPRHKQIMRPKNKANTALRHATAS